MSKKQNQARKRNFALMLVSGMNTNLKSIRACYAKDSNIIQQINNARGEIKKLIQIIGDSKTEDWQE